MGKTTAKTTIVNSFCDRCGKQAVECSFTASIVATKISSLVLEDACISLKPEDMKSFDPDFRHLKLICPNNHMWMAEKRRSGI